MPVRVRRAAHDDIEPIYRLISHYAEGNVILPRDRDDIHRSLEFFLVAESESGFSGIISYFDYGPGLKEIRSLAVRSDLKRTGIGRALLHELLVHLKKTFPPTRVFVLTYTPEFFLEAGFTVVDKDSLPEKIWKDCQNCINRDNCGETALITSI